ncbi:MAG: leucine-rich repeat domain-containing protein [Proteobacteria bacterium]|nr:leucine-rich repeat domain-containing protein [Pseudomonadota bacterium]
MLRFKKAKIYFRAMAQRITYPALLAIGVSIIVSLMGFSIIGHTKLAIMLVSALAVSAGTITHCALNKYLRYKKSLTLKSQHEVDTQINVKFNDQTIQTALSHHGSFGLPSELIKQIFEFLPIDKSWHVRQVNKSFFHFWESIAQNKLTNLPLVPALNTDQMLKGLNKKQQDEINHLIKHKEASRGHRYLPSISREALKIILQKLIFLKNETSNAACHAKELHLNRFNEIIIRNRIAASGFPHFFECADLGLTRFPSEIFSDNSLKEFWSKVTHFDLRYNHLSTLPDTIGACTNLQSLSVFENELTAIPEALIKSTTLQSICITANRFVSLPDNLGKIMLIDTPFCVLTKAQCLGAQKDAFPIIKASVMTV